MKRIALVAILLWLISLFAPQDLFAGAWTVPQHKLWSEVYTKGAWAKERFTSEYDRAQMPRDAKWW
jgi:hypothetical protein